MADILIKKASGAEEPFSTQKLERSLRSAGADGTTISKIVDDIREWIVPGITTKKIYGRAFQLLRRKQNVSAIRYRLKHAILQLGPTGYPFESFVGELFKLKGYSVDVGIVVDGQCVTHEMDVIATKDHHQHLVECKYHSDQGKQESIQVPLYVRSRVDDIIRKRQSMPEYTDYSFTGWVVTNTRFSSDSLHYGACAGLKLLAWDYPQENGLKDIIEELNLYPVTILQHLNLKQKQSLLESGIVTCAQAWKNRSLLNEMPLTPPKLRAVLKELDAFCR
jgi:hypothetical protein